MTEIKPMPCTGRIATETPGYEPCDDCQGMRALCGEPQCRKAPPLVKDEDYATTMTAQQAADLRARVEADPVEYPGSQFAGFETWLIANGVKAKTAHDTMKGARRCIEAGVYSPDEVGPDTLPGLQRSSLNIYRSQFRKYEQFLVETARPPIKAKVVTAETAEAIPEVVEAPEPATATQERAAVVEIVNRAPAPVEYPTVTPRETIAAVVDAAEQGLFIEEFLGSQVVDDEPPWMAVPGDAPIDAADEVLGEMRAAIETGHRCAGSEETNALLREMLAELKAIRTVLEKPMDVEFRGRLDGASGELRALLWRGS